ncbi:YobI family P-loop NTPase [Lactobacillus crispatus]|uniref:YobI family P-loop NTPase n=1 Tax=Lactobacillus crispatus TaxID=47770 RepID=UPI00195B88FE|nr:hypothetical protein [Lactobacillus crispatus]MBM6872083.1 hypothetical protein [Lactobacillus crispatus]
MNINDKSDAIRGALYSYDFLTEDECDPEWKNLDQALKDIRVTNIAVTAPYDTGKTSFLKSFFTQKKVDELKWRKEYLGRDEENLREKARRYIIEGKTNFKFISLPNFFEDIKDKKEAEIELEKDIIGQLLFNSDPWKFPDSKIKRLKKYPFAGILLLYIFILLFVFLLNNSTKLFDLNSYVRTGKYSSLITIIMGLFLGFGLFYFLIHYFSKISWTFSTKFNNSSIEAKIDSTSDNSKDLFLMYGDELKYYLYKSKIKYIIFEDLDRYNNPLIFQRLRELNQNLNVGRKRFVFIYTLKDSVFGSGDTSDDKGNESAQLKTKFFDYILPLMPITSIQNARNVFEKEINKYDILIEENYFERISELSKSLYSGEHFVYKGKIQEKYLNGLGQFITDRREIINIVFETASYAEKLKNREISLNKLIGIIVYKNKFPNDYEKVPHRTSYLDQIMHSQSVLYKTIIYKKTANLRQEIDILVHKKSEINKGDLGTIGDLADKKFDNFFQQKGTFYWKNSSYRQEQLDSNDKVKIIKEILSDSDESQSGNSKLELDLVDKLIFSESFELNQNLRSYIGYLVLERTAEVEDIIKEVNSKKYGEIIERILQESDNSKLLKRSFEKIIDYQNLSDKEQNLLIEGLMKVKTSRILRYLLFENLIDPTFYEYISSSAYNMSTHDLDFIQKVLSRQKLAHDYGNLNNVEKVNKELDIVGADYGFAYSSDLLIYLLNSKNNLSKIEEILDNSKQLKDLNIIFSVVNSILPETEEFKLFVMALITEWPTVFYIICNNSTPKKGQINIEVVDVQQFINAIMLYWFNSNDDDLFNLFEEEKIWETVDVQNELSLIIYREPDAVLDRKNKHQFKDLAFISRDIKNLLRLIKYGWYEENYNNFEIIMNRVAHNSYNSLLSLSLDENFIYKNWKKYNENSNINIDMNDFRSLYNWMKEFKDQEQRSNLKKELIRLYMSTNVKFTNSEKSEIIENLKIVKYLENEASLEKWNKLLLKNKLIYSKNILEVLTKYGTDIVVLNYVIAFENIDNLREIFLSTSWKLTFYQLSETKFKQKLIYLVDEHLSNVSEGREKLKQLRINTDDIVDVLYRGIRELISNTSKGITLECIIQTGIKFNKNDKDIILKRLIELHHPVQADLISKFYFEDEKFMDTWPLNGHEKITNIGDHQEQLDSWCKILGSKYIANKKGYVMKKALKTLFIFD